MSATFFNASRYRARASALQCFALSRSRVPLLIKGQLLYHLLCHHRPLSLQLLDAFTASGFHFPREQLPATPQYLRHVTCTYIYSAEGGSVCGSAKNSIG